jgi:tRNA(Ile)-lysidine synthase
MTTRLNPRDATFERLAADAITEGDLFPDAPIPIVVAVSGGPDSMALLHALIAWAKRPERAAGGGGGGGDSQPRRVIAAHVNHALRGSASEEDARFVAARAEEWGAEAVILEAAITSGARSRAAAGAAIEADARRARYAALREIAERAGADRVVTAHTADDQAETVLLRLVRGAGLRGLSGMAPLSRVQGIRIARPLLAVSREQVLEYLHRHEIPYRTDATNAETAAARNYVRHEIVPRLQARLNPAVREALLRAGSNFREADAYLERRAARIFKRLLLERDEVKISLDAPGLLLYPKLLRTYVFRRAVRELNGNLRDVATVHLRALHEVALSHRGHAADLPGGMRAERDRNRVVLSLVRPRKTEPKPQREPSKT